MRRLLTFDFRLAVLDTYKLSPTSSHISYFIKLILDYANGES
ncbi:hypothetical protein [Nostoc sp. LPT]|nr:hypothetical protein [Nostoc sp. LPT]